MQFTTTQETRLAVRIIIDQYNRYVRALDYELGLVVCVESDRTHTCYDVKLWYTSRVARYASDPQLQQDDARDCESILVPVNIHLDELENAVTEVLDRLSKIKLAA